MVREHHELFKIIVFLDPFRPLEERGQVLHQALVSPLFFKVGEPCQVDGQGCREQAVA